MKRSLLMLLIISTALLTACSKSSETAEHGSHTEMKSSDAAHTTSATWQQSIEKPKPNEDTTFTIQIQDHDGKTINDFEISHEKKMHLIVVSKDLSYFNHIHPEYKGKGSFEITTHFPRPGEYKMIADYIPSGGSATSQSDWVTVDGDPSVQEEIKPEAALSKSVDGIEVTLSFDHLMADMDLNLTFNMKDVKAQKPITDLQPYLGAVGHVVILSADTDLYLHVHPTDENAKGPDAQFITKFPQSGLYKIWGQFKRNGETFVVPFVVNVP